VAPKAADFPEIRRWQGPAPLVWVMNRAVGVHDGQKTPAGCLANVTVSEWQLHVVRYLVPLLEAVFMSITASEARRELFPLIKKVNEDHDAVEIVSRHGNAVLVSAEDYAALREGAYLLRSPANARRLLKAYENALNSTHLAEHDLVDPDSAGTP